MKTRWGLLTTSILIASALLVSSGAEKKIPYTKAQGEMTPFAVAELFTSEGCSSCPKADKLVSELFNNYRSKNLPVYLLAFHVDYWDHYGWTDIFGKPEFSKRQHQYASIFKLESVYTPQLIINGSEEMVGSDPQASEFIESALQKPAPVMVTLGPVISYEKKKIQFYYNLSEVPDNSILNFAVVERGLVREIWQGENKGRTLIHDNVVRYFQTIIKPAAHDSVEIELSAGLNVENSSIVVYLQDEKSWNILGADDLSLKSP
jgi:hypothetical protein